MRASNPETIYSAGNSDIAWITTSFTGSYRARASIYRRFYPCYTACVEKKTRYVIAQLLEKKLHAQKLSACKVYCQNFYSYRFYAKNPKGPLLWNKDCVLQQTCLLRQTQ